MLSNEAMDEFMRERRASASALLVHAAISGSNDMLTSLRPMFFDRVMGSAQDSLIAGLKFVMDELDMGGATSGTSVSLGMCADDPIAARVALASSIPSVSRDIVNASAFAGADGGKGSVADSDADG